MIDELVCEGLRALLIETDLEWDDDDPARDLANERTRAAFLARQMRQAGRGDPNLLASWIAASETDALPDVRNAFDGLDTIPPAV